MTRVMSRAVVVCLLGALCGAALANEVRIAVASTSARVADDVLITVYNAPPPAGAGASVVLETLSVDGAPVAEGTAAAQWAAVNGQIEYSESDKTLTYVFHAPAAGTFVFRAATARETEVRIAVTEAR